MGFILSFSIILLSVGLIFSFGFGAIQGLQETEQDTNGERAMLALAENFEAIQRGAGPARKGELRLSGSALSIQNNSEITVTVDRPGGTYEKTTHLQSLVYDSETTDVTYQGGAVFRGEERSVMQSEPAISCTDEYARISLVRLKPAENGTTAISSSASVLVTARAANRSLLFPTETTPKASAADSVTIDLADSTVPDGWNDYFEDHDDWVSTGSAEYECSADRIYVRETVLTIDILR